MDVDSLVVVLVVVVDSGDTIVGPSMEVLGTSVGTSEVVVSVVSPPVVGSSVMVGSLIGISIVVLLIVALVLVDETSKVESYSQVLPIGQQVLSGKQYSVE